MRNFIFVFVLLFSINLFSQSRISQDNFEGNSTITTWFGDNCGMDNAFANPFQNGINTSASNLKWFPKSLCTIERIEPVDRKKELPTYFLTAPKWLIDKNIDK